MRKLLLFILLGIGLNALAQTPPTISSFSPLSGPVGTNITIAGTNFNTTLANNLVFFGAVAAQPIAVTATSMTVTVPAGASYDQISVLNIISGLSGSSSQYFNPTFTLNKGSISASDIAPKQDLVLDTRSYAVAIGDLDRDGKPDLAVTRPGRVSVFLNTSSAGSITAGSFAAKKDFATGSNPESLAIGDLDGDGKLDLAVANAGTDNVSVLRNIGSTGNIDFAPRLDFAVGDLPYSIAIGDLDGDGKPDLAIANVASDNASVLRNIGSPGNISFAAKRDFATGAIPYSIAMGDLDGDGKLDLTVANTGSNNASVFRNISSSGNISFAAKQDFPIGFRPYSIVIGDLDGDGKPDLAATNTGMTVSVVHNTSTSGSISFAATQEFATGYFSYSVALGDLDGDGKVDLAVVNQSSNNVSVLRNTSSTGSITASSFAAKQDFVTGDEPNSVAIGDLDGDGKPDLAIANFSANTVSVLRNLSNYIPDANGILYVKKGATGSGTSWSSPMGELADALKFAKTNNAVPSNPQVSQIWVAKGAYKPMYSPRDGANFASEGRNNAFLMVANVKLYGGFAGTESTLAQRDLSISANKSILSGDIGTINSATDNAYHVVIAAGAVGAARLDGFGITGGYADGIGTLAVNSNLIYQDSGGGMYNYGSSPVLTEVAIYNNTSSSFSSSTAASGGGMYNGVSSPILTNVAIYDNTSSTSSISYASGGGMYNISSSPVLTNVAIYNNIASSSSAAAAFGGGMYNVNASNPVLTNVTIANNKANANNLANSIGGGIRNNNSSPKIYNSIIWGNTKYDSTSSDIENGSGTITIKNSITQGFGVSTIDQVVNTDPLFTNPASGDFSLQPISPAINKGDNTLYTNNGGSLTTDKDLTGKPRSFDNTIDMGAYENQTVQVLPVTFGKFTATLQGNRVKLDWNTFSETNNKAFIIYRSKDGKNYVEVVQQPSKSSNANSYIAYDHHPVNGLNYYRLKQQDLDGTVTELGDDAVNFSLGDGEIKAWPNPTDKYLKISFAAGKYQILKLVDITGKKLQEHVIGKAQNEAELDLSNYTKGVYIVELKGSNTNHIIKVLK